MATEIPGYVKILQIGSRGSERLFEGNVSVSEKVDGSQFRAGINENGNLVFASHHNQLYLGNIPKMFEKAVEYIQSVETELRSEAAGHREIYYYCEYLNKPHHNTLNYAKVPKNNLALFGVLLGSVPDPLDDSPAHFIYIDTHSWLQSFADILDIDIVPELYCGPATLSSIQQYLKTPSYLGSELVEGIVIKNYKENILIGSRLQPVFAKLVREKFKERHSKEWKRQSGKSKVQNFIESFCNEARWRKAVQYLRDEDNLQEAVQDIGPLCKRVSEDIVAEEEDYIKTELYKLYIKDIRRASVRGLAEWYKSLLAGRLECEETTRSDKERMK